MTAWVGGFPPVMYAGVITAVAAPYVTVQLTDDPEIFFVTDPIVATGTGTVGDKVQVMIQPTGRAITVKA